VDALATRGEEGRGQLRKARGSRSQAVIPGCPNGTTHVESNHHVSATESIGRARPTQGSETSQYLQEKKSNEMLLVAASERGGAQTGRRKPAGVVGPPIRDFSFSVEPLGTAGQRG